MPTRPTRLTAWIVALAALAPVCAGAQQTPGAEENKRQLLLAHQAANAEGICSVFEGFQRWQAANWPEGRPTFERFMNERVLPNFLQDPATLQGKSALEIQSELVSFCAQARGMARAARNQLDAILNGQTGHAPTEAEKAQVVQVRESLDSATFRGECATASPLHFGAAESEKESIGRYVEAEIYGKDEKYRQHALDTDALTGDSMGAVADVMNTFKENRDREGRYWSDCDAAEARLAAVVKQLTSPAP